MGNTGKANRVIPEDAPIPNALRIQTVSAARQAAVFRIVSTSNGAKASTIGPRNCQNPRCAGSMAALSIAPGYLLIDAVVIRDHSFAKEERLGALAGMVAESHDIRRVLQNV